MNSEIEILKSYLEERRESREIMIYNFLESLKPLMLFGAGLLAYTTLK